MRKPLHLLWLATLLVGSPLPLSAQANIYPHNAVSCERCHNTPSQFGGSAMTVVRTGVSRQGDFAPAVEGGIRHRYGESRQNVSTANQVTGERISLALLGDGYIEAIDGRDIERNAERQRQENMGVSGMLVMAPVLEARGLHPVMQVGRFGWKSQHSSLRSSCADSLRNELGIRNRLYAEEYGTHSPRDDPSPMDQPDPTTHQAQLDQLVAQLRQTHPPARSEDPGNEAGEKLFAEIGCSSCHVPTYKTLPAGTWINGGTYRVPESIGSSVIHPYSDFLLHDVGTGDGIPQAAKPEYLDQATANKFRTPPLWGLRFRYGLMHDGNSPGIEAAITRHAGEAAATRRKYEALQPARKQEMNRFLGSL